MDLRVFAAMALLFGVLTSNLNLPTVPVIVADFLPHMNLWQDAIHLLRLAGM